LRDRPPAGVFLGFAVCAAGGLSLK